MVAMTIDAFHGCPTGLCPQVWIRRQLGRKRLGRVTVTWNATLHSADHRQFLVPRGTLWVLRSWNTMAKCTFHIAMCGMMKCAVCQPMGGDEGRSRTCSFWWLSDILVAMALQTPCPYQRQATLNFGIRVSLRGKVGRSRGRGGGRRLRPCFVWHGRKRGLPDLVARHSHFAAELASHKLRVQQSTHLVPGHCVRQR